MDTCIHRSRDRGLMLRREYAEDSLVIRVGMRIRKLRMEQGVSLRNFGKIAGVHPFHVMAIELGQLAANIRTLRSIARGLGVTPLDLLNHDVENDDMGHLVELMRKQPDFVQKIMLKVKPLVEN
jgi:transcriptional regulator with XRE-family HTH domain